MSQGCYCDACNCVQKANERAEAWKAAYLTVNKLGRYTDPARCTGPEFERIRDEASDARDIARALERIEI